MVLFIVTEFFIKYEWMKINYDYSPYVYVYILT
jgi:hypothetical protein